MFVYDIFFIVQLRTTISLINYSIIFYKPESINEMNKEQFRKFNAVGDSFSKINTFEITGLFVDTIEPFFQTKA